MSAREEIRVVGYNLNNLKKETISFLVITFGLTYLLNYFMWSKYDFFANQIEYLYLALALQMLIPAFSSIIVSLFTYKQRFTMKAHLFFYYFLLYTAVTAISFVLLLAFDLQFDFVNNIIGGMSYLGLALIIVLNLKKRWREELSSAKLSFGTRPSYYLWFGLLLVCFYIVNAFLNCSLGLGKSVDVDLQTLFVSGVMMAIAGPILSLAGGFFGEEYGWRIFLQDRLTSLFGRLRGVLLVGVIWGFWHAPMVAGFGWTYPGYPQLGVALFTIFTVELAIILGFAVFKSGSVWIAAFLHGVINNMANYAVLYICTPSDPVYSFGTGLYGLIIMVIIIGFVLKSKEWGKPVLKES